MALIRILILGLAIWLVYRMVKNYQLRQQQKPSQRPQRVTNMVACKHCGLHLPENEAIRVSSKEYYCCKEHQTISNRG